MEVFDQGTVVVFDGGVTMVLRTAERAKTAGAEAKQ
jgi:hypothetical protein